MRSSTSRSTAHRVQPSRLVSIDSRKHIPPNPTRTRIGMGEAFFDHAAGRPLNMRQSFQGIPQPSNPSPRYEHGIRSSAAGRHYVIAPVAPDDWDAHQPSIHDRDRLQGVMDANEAPVDLPLRSRTRMYFAITGLVVAFIAMLVGTFFAGATTSVDGPPPAGPVEPDMPVSR